MTNLSARTLFKRVPNPSKLLYKRAIKSSVVIIPSIRSTIPTFDDESSSHMLTQ